MTLWTEVMGKRKKTCEWYVACPMKRYYERGILDEKWIKKYCWDAWEKCIRYHMEERGESHPDWMLPDGTLNQRLKRLCL